MNDRVTPIFRKDWAMAVAAGFEQINGNQGYRNTPTDDLFEGMARSFERQESDWLYEQQQLGTYVRLFDRYLDEFRTVPANEVAEIEESNEKHKQSEVDTAKWKAERAEEKKRNKWWSKCPINWPFHSRNL